MGKYCLDESTGAPINPSGRTGMTGRGLLGKWGPNHAADPVVTRWHVDSKSGKQSKKFIEFVVIRTIKTTLLYV